MNYQRQRHRMVRRLQKAGIQDPAVLQVMDEIPRERFVPHGLEHRAYAEESLPIGFGQTISHPYTVARMTELLEPAPGEKVLEVGTGSGYQAAVLAALKLRLYSIEYLVTLTDRARRTLSDLRLPAIIRSGDGSRGWSEHAPYDGIIVTAGAPVVPEKLKRQLADHGRLIIPMGAPEGQKIHRFRRSGDDWQEEIFDDVIFVPLQGEYGWHPQKR